MKVTLTGATGFVGSRLVDALTARGDEVTVLSRDAPRARGGLACRYASVSASAPSMSANRNV